MCARYDSVSDVARAAFRLLQELEERRAALLRSLQVAEGERAAIPNAL